jgi:hypothetical protein
MGRMTNYFLLAPDELPLKIAKRTQGGQMTRRFFARDGLPLDRCDKLRNEPKAVSFEAGHRYGG